MVETVIERRAPEAVERGSALADTSDVKAFEHLLGLVAKALSELGDTDPID